MNVSTKVELIYTPKENTIADLIFIHGIGQDWKRTWRHSTDAKFTWIKDQLPLELPSFQLGCWGCSVREPGLLNQEAQSAADKLLQDVDSFRETASDRPIIFIAHSLGGIVLKRALLNDQTPERSSKLLGAVAGILFISVPNFFNSQESWTRFLNNIYSPEKATNHSIERTVGTKSLQDSPGSDLRLSIARDYKLFGELLRREKTWKPRIYSACETWPVYRTGILVEPKTAEIPGYGFKGVPANHFSITYLDRDTNPLYRWLCDWLGAIIRCDTETLDMLETGRSSAPPKSQIRTKDAPDGRTEILNSLSKYPDPDPSNRVRYALVLEDEGYYGMAESAWSTAIKACQTATGPNSLEALFCKDKLIYNYWHQGNYTEAERQCHGLAELRRREHPNDQKGMLATMRNNALVLRSLGQLKRAYELLVYSLESTQNVEPSSLEYLLNFHLVALLLNDLGYCKLSEHLFKEVVQDCHSHFGPDHPYTLNRMSDLAVVLAMRGKAQQAHEYNSLAYAGLEARYGMHHPATLRAFRRHAMNKLFQGEYDESCKAFETLLPRYQQKMGDTHPSCLSSMSGLATAYILRGPVGPGKRLLEKTHVLQTAHPGLGKRHRDTRWTGKLLTLLAEAEGKAKVNPSASNIYRDELEPFLLESWGRFGGKGPDQRENKSSVVQNMSTANDNKSNLMPEVDFLPTGTDTQKLRAGLLKGSPIDFQYASLNGYTEYASNFGGGLIHIAAYSDSLALVRRLLSLGVDVDQTAGIFRTPMKAAAMRGNIEILNELLRYRAQRNLVNMSPALTPVDTAIVFDEQDAIELLLTPYTDLPSYTSIYGEPLLQAVADVNVEVTQALLRRNTDPQVRSGIARRNPLEQAANIAHSSYVLLNNSLQQGDRLLLKYNKNRRLFEILFTFVLERFGTSGQADEYLSPAEAKYIESLQARVVMESEEPLPAYQPSQLPSSQTEPTLYSSPDPVIQSVAKTSQVAPPSSLIVPMEQSRTNTNQGLSAFIGTPLFLGHELEEPVPEFQQSPLATGPILAETGIAFTESPLPLGILPEANTSGNQGKTFTAHRKGFSTWIKDKISPRRTSTNLSQSSQPSDRKFKNRLREVRKSFKSATSSSKDSGYVSGG